MTVKSVIVGVCGGIAAYKSCELIRKFVKLGHDVHCILTKAGAQFITPLTLQTLSQNAVHQDMFNLIDESKIGHISLARRADIVVVAPATADLIAKVAVGICDDLLTTVICATKAPVLFAPSMNDAMWENPITRRNVNSLSELGYHFVEPDFGELACGTSGGGRLAPVQAIAERATKILGNN